MEAGENELNENECRVATLHCFIPFSGVVPPRGDAVLVEGLARLDSEAPLHAGHELPRPPEASRPHEPPEGQQLLHLLTVQGWVLSPTCHGGFESILGWLAGHQNYPK